MIDRRESREHLRANILVDRAVRLLSQGIEAAEIPLYIRTTQLKQGEEVPAIDKTIGHASLPRQFIDMPGEIGDISLIDELKGILKTAIGYSYEMNRFSSDFVIVHTVSPSLQYPGLYLGRQSATEYRSGLHAVRNSLLISPSNLRAPAAYNMFLARIALPNGHKR